MKIKKYIAAALITMFMILPVDSNAQNMYDSIGCCGLAILIPALIIQKWIDGIEDMIEALDDSRTVSVSINGKKAVFQRNTIVENDKKKGGIVSGTLIEGMETTILGRSIKIRPGEVQFHKNGNVARCLISESELFAGDNTVVKCVEYAEFYDDGYLKCASIADNQYKNISEADGKCSERTFLIQGIPRFLNGSVSFYNNGNVENCRLKNDESFKIAGYETAVLKGSMLRFTGNGILVYIKPEYGKSISIKFKGAFLSLSDDIFLYENGSLRFCTLSEDLSILNGSHKLRVNGGISFYDNEFIENCRIARPALLKLNKNSLEFRKDKGWGDASLSFYRNGNVKSGETAENRKQHYIQNGYRINIEAGSLIEFYDNGLLKKTYPEKGTSLKAGENILNLYDDSLNFYDDGKVLSAHIQYGSGFIYQGHILRLESYTGRLFFNHNQEVIAFTNDAVREMTINGVSVLVPKYYEVGYDDYDKKTVSFIRIYPDNITLPDNVRIDKIEENQKTGIFVKAEIFITDKYNEKLSAKGVSEIMFTADTVILIDGEEHFCRAMDWVRLSDR